MIGDNSHLSTARKALAVNKNNCLHFCTNLNFGQAIKKCKGSVRL